MEAEPLYQAHCALCHGKDGDGQGALVLDRPARSFLKGAFSFGNTEEALFRTISNGIGGTPMPGFKSTLSDEQRRALAAYVIALGPEQVQVRPGESEYQVTDRPLVVRGGLPPIADGLAPVNRGLLVGGLDGLTFEYNTKPLALLGVRQGEFVDRKDWQGRGGASLQPLGVVSHLIDGGFGTCNWEAETGSGGWIPQPAALVATTVLEGRAWVEYDLIPGHSGEALRVKETGLAISLGGWPGFQRIFHVIGGLGFERLRLAELADHKVELVAKGPAGRLLRRLSEGEEPTFYFKHGLGMEGDDQVMIVDTLFGLAPTDENLKALKELVQ